MKIEGGKKKNHYFQCEILPRAAGLTLLPSCTCPEPAKGSLPYASCFSSSCPTPWGLPWPLGTRGRKTVSGVVAGPPGGLDGGAGAAAFIQCSREREVAAAWGSSHGAAAAFSFLPLRLRQDLTIRHLTLHPTPHGGNGAVLLPYSPTPRNHPFQKVPRDAHTPKPSLPEGPQGCYTSKPLLPEGPQGCPHPETTPSQRSPRDAQQHRGAGVPKHPSSPRSHQDHSPGRLLFTSSRYWSTEVRIL